MKLRIHKNSLRLRFNVEEVKALGRGETLSESLVLGPGPAQRLDYCVLPVESTGATTQAIASLDGTALTISVAADALGSWSAAQDLALSAEVAWEGGRLAILLEKDMQRLNPKPGEPAEPLFPNPLFGKARCDHP